MSFASIAEALVDIRFLLCVLLSAVGSIGMTFPSLAERQGLPVNPGLASPGGAVFSLVAAFGSVGLAWSWLGIYPAIAVYPLGLLIAFLLTRIFGWHVQGVWLLGQLVFVVGGGWVLVKWLLKSVQ